MKDLSLRRFVAGVWRQLFHVDGRLWRSLAELLLRPGESARAALDAEQEADPRPMESAAEKDRAFHPVRVYLVANLLFFLVVPILNTDEFTLLRNDLEVLSDLWPTYQLRIEAEAARLGAPVAVYEAVLDSWIRGHQGAFVAALIPLFALVLYALFGRRRRYFAEHLLFSTTYYTVFLITMPMLGLLGRLLLAILPLTMIWFTLPPLLWLLGMLLWLGLGLRRFYDLRPVMTLATATLAFGFFALTFVLYTHLLFWAGIVAQRFSA